MTREELTALLAPYNISPIRDRGQHFLLDGGVVEKMLEAAGVQAGDRVLEIGPGPGILTEGLLRAGAEVVAAEIDVRMIKLLRDRFAGDERLHILDGDVRMFKNGELVGAFRSPGAYRVVANLPYGITTETFLKFLREEPRPASLTVMIQREVADRVLAEPGDMSSIAVLLQTLADVHRVVDVPASSFYPPPKVESAVIHIALKSEQYLSSFFDGIGREAYFSAVRAAFAAPRKQMRNTLGSMVKDESRLNTAFSLAGIAPSARPEELSVDDWRRLTSALS